MPGVTLEDIRTRWAAEGPIEEKGKQDSLVPKGTNYSNSDKFDFGISFPARHFVVAASVGNLEKMQKNEEALIENGLDINCKGERGRTAVQMAA
eukprot:7334384-Prymnesium_polylepis.1